MAVGIPQRYPLNTENSDHIERHFVKGMAAYAYNFGNNEKEWLANGGVLIGSNSTNNFLDLENGNILLSPVQNIVVSTREGSLYISAGASVFIIESGNDVVIYDLLQTKPNQVFFIVNQHKLMIEPGHMLVITKQNTDEFDQLAANCHCVTYRNAKSLNLHDNTVTAFVANFSIASALVTIEPLKQLTISNHKQDQTAFDRLVKSAVILGNIRPSARISL